MPERNILVTGVPRGGTTLTTYLLSQLSDCISLNEPMNVYSFVPNELSFNLDLIDKFFSEQRQSVAENKTAISKTMNGKLVPNPLSDEKHPNSTKRVKLIDSRTLHIQKQVPENYIMTMKHNATFTAMLGQLVGRYDCLVLMRNPLAVLLSWQNVNMSVYNGRVPAAERLLPALTEKLDSIADRIDRQIAVLSWFFEQFKQAPSSSIIRYEHLIATKAVQLPSMIGSSDTLSYDLTSRNLLETDAEKRLFFADKLMRQGGHFLDFYSHDDIRRLALGEI